MIETVLAVLDDASERWIQPAPWAQHRAKCAATHEPVTTAVAAASSADPAKKVISAKIVTTMGTNVPLTDPYENEVDTIALMPIRKPRFRNARKEATCRTS